MPAATKIDDEVQEGRGHLDEVALDDPALDEELEEESLIEAVSIDGMCGVY
jgi:mycofactocin precursor